MAHALDDVSRLQDAELICRLERLAKADRALSAKLLVHLGEVEARGLHCARGFGSMFEYCRSALGMSEAEAYLRIHAARVGRRLPLVVERLGAGAVHLSAIKLLAPLLTEDNHVELLDLAQGKTKRQIETIVADLAPKPDVPARMRRLPEPRGSRVSETAATFQVVPGNSESTRVAAVGLPAVRASSEASGAVMIGVADGAAVASVSSQNAAPAANGGDCAVLEPTRVRGSCTPLGLGRFKLQLTLEQEAHDVLDQLVELFRHQNPSGDLTPIVVRALRELLERTMKRRFGQTRASQERVMRASASLERVVDAQACAVGETKTKRVKKLSKSRYIPRAVLREVYARDLGQCTFVSAEGRRCAARGFLEVHHHDTAFARGGAATVENLRLACRSHNLFLAARDYGRELMATKLREARGQKRQRRELVPNLDSVSTR